METTQQHSTQTAKHHVLNRSIAIIGAGNMGSALMKGVINARLTPSEKITACGVHLDKLQQLSAQWQVAHTLNLREAVEASEIILLCVKPQTVPAVLEQMKPSLRDGHLLISIAAGITIEFLTERIGKALPVVRTMPNIASTVDEGATALAFGKNVSEEHQRVAISIFEAVGEVVVVAEEQLDAVTGLSGSGPAYIYMVIEALIDGGVKMGLSRDISTKLAIQTVLGSATLVKASGLHPAILRDQVTTPAGAAINAIHELESHGLRSMLINAVATATRRSKELSTIISSQSK
ncbi:MAG: pyrroline-5-carboxylate reductase [Ignavibacteriae bacterium]|nr:pyrroline-5-carboxylate reductase [Ignavibacteriota bacterium]